MSHSLAVFALVLASLPSCSALPAAVDAVDARFLVLPPPRSILASGAPRALSADFSVTATGLGSSSPLLAAAMLREGARLREAIAAAGPTASDASALTGIVLDVASSDETLDVRADYSYTLTADAGSATVHATARSVFGALSALTSLRQLASRGGGGALPHAAIAIDDAPDWPHRGIMIDSGRRFFPVPLVETLIDTMQLLKMSLLHLHVSDECRFGIQSKLFPNLTAGLIGDYAGFYTQDDIRGLVTYGLARGVRIMFEMDIPGHSKGLLPLQQYGAVFCDPTDSTCSQMYGDPANKTYNVLTALLGEMVPLFVEPVVHIGADETGVVGVCTIESTFAVERLVLDFIQNDLHRTPAGWEELLFDANAATPETVIYAWSRHNPASITSQGYQTVNNNASHFYTTAPGGSYPEGWERFYFDIAQGLTPAERQLLQGGEVSQWTDTYCITDQCGAYNGAVPVGAALFPPSQDAAFAQSIGGMLFPRSIVAASAFWNFNSSLSPSDPAFVAAIWAVNDQITKAGGVTCPSQCVCDQLTQCGKPIIPPTPAAINNSVTISPCTLPTPALQAFTLGADGVLTIPSAGDARLCVANPVGGSGNPTYPLKLAATTSADCVTWSRGLAGRFVDSKSGGCMDVGGHGVGIYECGSGSGLIQFNQAWAADASLGGVISLQTEGTPPGGCLTASAAGTQ